MGNGQRQLSQAEIWDDSALVKSWDDALQEYKLYHSLHARGERIEDVLKEVREESEAGGDASTANINHTVSASTYSHVSNEVSKDRFEDGDLKEKTEKEEESVQPASSTAAMHSMPTARMQGLLTVPDVAMTNGELIKDEALKNLMLSWYYAGYYTGLYEGQNQATVTVPQDK